MIINKKLSNYEKSIHSVFLSALAGSLVLSSCKKDILEPAGNITTHTENTNTAAHREERGYSTISLGIGSSGESMINTNDDLTVPSGSYQNILYNGVPLDYMTGITRLFYTTDALLGTTGSASQKPGSLFLIDVNNGFKATDLGNTRIGSSTGAMVYLQNIEAVHNGSLFYAIEEGTTNIYVSVIPQGGSFPLIWNLTATVSFAIVCTCVIFHE